MSESGTAVPAPRERAAAERRLIWKLDFLLMPLLTVTLGLQYYDKAALGSAVAFGILKDLVCPDLSPPTLGARPYIPTYPSPPVSG